MNCLGCKNCLVLDKFLLDCPKCHWQHVKCSICNEIEFFEECEGVFCNNCPSYYCQSCSFKMTDDFWKCPSCKFKNNWE